MVVTWHQDNGYAPLMGGIYELFQIGGGAIFIVDGKGKYAIVPPVMMTGKLGNGH